MRPPLALFARSCSVDPGNERTVLLPGPWRCEILAGISAIFGRLSNQDRLANRSSPRREATGWLSEEDKLALCCSTLA
jgi:hypothetical protein